MITHLNCPREQWPPCAVTFQTEGDLITHYIARHHSPTEDAYNAACEALRKKTVDLARALPIVEAAGRVVSEYGDLPFPEGDDGSYPRLGEDTAALENAIRDLARAVKGEQG